MYAIRSAAWPSVLVVALSCSRPPSVTPTPPDVILPTEPVLVDGKSGVEWLEAFASSGGRNLPALWKAYDAEDHGAEFEQKLHSLRAAISDPLGAEAVDAFLDLRRIPHDCPGISGYRGPGIKAGPGTIAITEAPFGWPFPLVEAQEPALIAMLESADPLERARAALTLLARHGRADVVVAGLIRRLDRDSHGAWSGHWRSNPSSFNNSIAIAHEVLDAYVLTFAKHYLGSGFDDVVLGLLKNSHDDPALRRFLVKQVGFSGRSDPRTILEALHPWVDDGDATTRAILRTVIGSVPCSFPYYVAEDLRTNAGWSDPYCRVYTNTHEWPEIDGAIATSFADMLARCLEQLLPERLEPSVVRSVAIPVLTSEAVQNRVIPVVWRIAELGGPNSEEAFRLLAALGVDDLRVREAYAIRVAREVASGRMQYGWQALLVHHDSKTIECLARAIRNAGEPEAFALAILMCRNPGPEIEVRFNELKATVLENASKPSGWRWLYKAKWPDPPPHLQDADPTNRVYKLATAIRVCRNAGADDAQLIERFAHVLDDVRDPQGDFGPRDPYTTWWITADDLGLAHPAMTDFALRHLIKIEGFHNDGISQVLLRATVDKEQARVLASLSPLFVESHRIAEILADQEHGFFEVIPRVRLEFSARWSRESECARFVVDLDRLDLIFRSGAVSRAAREWLVLALDQGLARERERALRIVDERGVDDAEVRVAVERRRDDPDRAVRELATRVLTR